MVMQKRGISAIVATVLIILITVAAVTIIWATIIPMISKSTDFQDPDMRFDIVSSQGYTFYDQDAGRLYVQVKRGSDSENVVGLDIVVTSGGNSKTYSYGSDYVPGPNQAKTFIIDLGVNAPKPDSIKVVPVINTGNTVERGSVTSQAEVVFGNETTPGTTTPTDNQECTVAADCDDANACTTDACTANSCTHTQMDCSSFNSDCSVGTCTAGTCGANPTNVGGSCNSGNGVCNASGICVPNCGNGICGIGESCPADCSSEYSTSNFMLCKDGVDNDGDTFSDCADSDCATKNVCLWSDANFPGAGSQVNFIYPFISFYVYTPTNMYSYTSTRIWSSYNFTQGNVDKGNSTYLWVGNRMYYWNSTLANWTNTNYPGATADRVYTTYASSGNSVYQYSTVTGWNNTLFPGSTVTHIYLNYAAAGSAVYQYSIGTYGWTNLNFPGGNVDFLYSNWAVGGNEVYYYSYVGIPSNGTWVDTNFTGGTVARLFTNYVITTSGDVWSYDTATGVWTDRNFPGSTITASGFGTGMNVPVVASENNVYYWNITIGNWTNTEFPFGSGIKVLGGYSGNRIMVANTTGSVFYADLP
jgi:hypothetical protein